MAAYVIVEIEVTDPELYETYKTQAPAAVAAYGGMYIARGGRTQVLEGDWSPKRLVILEFETFEQAVAWWNSPEYSAIKGIRQQATVSKMVALEGVG